MKIYNFLFYHGYKLSKNSENFNDIPQLGGILYVIPCLLFNLSTLSFILEGFGVLKFIFDPKYKYLFCFILIIILLFYFSYKKRYLKIIQKYENQNKNKKLSYSIIVVIFYLVVNFGFLIISGLFKNKDWIFK
jgi:hypothetical protein